MPKTDKKRAGAAPQPNGTTKSKSESAGGKPRKRKSRPEGLRAREKWTTELLFALADAEGTQNTGILKAFGKLQAAAAEFVEKVRAYESRETPTWGTLLQMWVDYYGGRSVAALAYTDSCIGPASFRNPGRALEFLRCPPLTGEKLGRLFSGLDKPKNPYEKWVAQLPEDRQEEALKWEPAGPKECATFRIRALLREEALLQDGAGNSRKLCRNHARAVSKDARSDLPGEGFGSELLDLDRIIKEYDPLIHSTARTWGFIRWIMPPDTGDEQKEPGDFERARRAEQAFRERISNDCSGMPEAMASEESE